MCLEYICRFKKSVFFILLTLLEVEFEKSLQNESLHHKIKLLARFFTCSFSPVVMAWKCHENLTKIILFTLFTLF